jgi:hypothetical protein
MGKDVDTVKVSSGRNELLQAFHEITGKKDVDFGEIVWMASFSPQIRMVDKFSHGRVFLAGGELISFDRLTIHDLMQLCRTDAAHVHSPTGGQVIYTSICSKHDI